MQLVADLLGGPEEEHLCWLKGNSRSCIQNRSEKLHDAFSAANKENFNKPGDVQYAKDLSPKKSRDATMESVAG